MGRGVNFWNWFWEGMFGAADGDALPGYVFSDRDGTDIAVADEFESFAAWQSSVSHLAVAERLASDTRH